MKNTTGKSVHRSIKTLEEAVGDFLADFDHQIDRIEKAKKSSQPHTARWHTIEDALPIVRKLRATYDAVRGDAPPVPRSPYKRHTREAVNREGEIEETHESFGVVHISRVQGTRRLFGSSVNHQNFFTLRIYRGRRIMAEFGEHYYSDGNVPIVEIALSPAQFVDMITAMNMGSGVPCTITDVEGVQMDPTPDGAGSEIKLTVEMFKDRLKDVISGIRAHDDELAALLDKKTFTKEDKQKIRSAVHKARRFMEDSTPYTLKLVGEHTEKLIAKGRMEIDAFIQLAIKHAGIKAIKDSDGVLLLGKGDDEKE